MVLVTDYVDPAAFFAIILVSALAGAIATFAGDRGLLVPAVVVELLFGVVLGPHVIGTRRLSSRSLVCACEAICPSRR
ncbi:MAG TPA: hypothetical protein VGF95_16370 [Solirubrobacteraceae bacterium]|jgi:NhaP-type Na+/H+ or K+/H+ antiporter